VSTAGSSFVAIAAGGVALLFVLGGIVALVAYLIDPRYLDLSAASGKAPAKSASAKVPAAPRLAVPAASAKSKPAR
jgi:hypothetical protein